MKKILQSFMLILFLSALNLYAEDGEEKQAEEVELMKCLSQARESVAEQHLVASHAGSEVLVFGIFIGLTLLGQQIAGEEDEVDQTCQGDDYADL